MTVCFNNETISVETSSLQELIIEKNLLETKGIAVALNDKVIPKKDWINTTLREGDRILVITATQGG